MLPYQPNHARHLCLQSLQNGKCAVEKTWTAVSNECASKIQNKRSLKPQSPVLYEEAAPVEGQGDRCPHFKAMPPSTSHKQMRVCNLHNRNSSWMPAFGPLCLKVATEFLFPLEPPLALTLYKTYDYIVSSYKSCCTKICTFTRRLRVGHEICTWSQRPRRESRGMYIYKDLTCDLRAVEVGLV